MATHAVVHWEKEKAFSCVSLSKVDIGDCGLDEVLDKDFRIKWQKKFVSGKIVGLGTKAKMTALELQLAQKAADDSFEESDNTDDDRGLELSPKIFNTTVCVPHKAQKRKTPLEPNCGANSELKRKTLEQKSEQQPEDDLQIKGTGEINFNLRTSQSASINHNLDTFSEDVISIVQVDSTSINPKLPESTQESQSVRPVQPGVMLEPGNYVVNNGDEEVLRDTRAEEIREELMEKDNIISTLQAENLSLKKQLKKLMRLTERSEVTNQATSEKVAIAPGVELDRSLVELTKIGYITRPSLFIRKLLFEGGLFELDEIAGSSMNGKASPVTPSITRPCLDSCRFGALKEFTIKTCGLLPKTLDYVDFHQKLKNIPGDARKKLKKILEKRN